MKLLHIDSSILGDNSASRQLSQSVVKAWQAAEPSSVVTYRDLAADEAELSASTLEEFLAADAIVIAAPMYNFSVPTQLKAWIDRIVVAGKTFRYTENGPEGLAAGKKVVIVSTAGGLHVGLPTGVGHEDYLKVLFGFLGITDIEFVRAHGLGYGEEVRTKAMSDAQALISDRLFAAA